MDTKIKSVLGSVLVIGIVAAMMTAGTQSLYSDTETSVGNTFTAGTLDLTVNGSDDPIVHITVDDIYPGWSGRYSWIVKNVGTIDGQPSIEFSAITNNENGIEEPEADATGENGGEPGELGGILRMNIYWCQGGGSWNYIGSSNLCGDPILNSIGGKTVGLGAWTGCHSDIPLPVLSQDEEVEIQLRPFWHDDPGIDDNKAQGDSVEFDIIFHLDQA